MLIDESQLKLFNFVNICTSQLDNGLKNFPVTGVSTKPRTYRNLYLSPIRRINLKDFFFILKEVLRFHRRIGFIGNHIEHRLDVFKSRRRTLRGRQ